MKGFPSFSANEKAMGRIFAIAWFLVLCGCEDKAPPSKIVICGDEVERKKPDPMPLIMAAERLGTKPQSSMMLGDSMSDVNAARAAEFQIVCMSYGYNHGEDIRDYDPDAVIDSMDEIRDVVDW